MTIPLMEPSITEQEVEKVTEVIESGWLSHHGPEVEQFEEDFEKYLDVEHAVTTSSGTDALRLIFESLGIGEGDEVIVPTLSYIATVSPVVHAGAIPRFVDVERHNFALDTSAVENAITDNTAAIVVSNLYGHVGPLEHLRTIADKEDVYLIEDAAESLGAFTPAGNYAGTVGDAAIFSFTGTKILSTGQGGMAVTDSLSLWQEMDHLKHHATTNRRDNGYRHNDMGFNFCMSNVQAALGIVQLERYDEMLQARKKIGQMYWDNLEPIMDQSSNLVYIHPSAEDSGSVWWHPVLRFATGRARLRAENRLDNAGIDTRRVFYPLPWQSAFDSVTGDAKAKVASSLYEKCLLVPCWPEMTEEQVDTVCSELEEAL